jgi:hypothetical protein
MLLVWLVAPSLLLRQLSLKMRHQSRSLLVWLLCCHHLLPHSLLQQMHNTKHPEFPSNRQYTSIWVMVFTQSSEQLILSCH